MKAFIPVPDDFDLAARIPLDRLVPYQVGLPCLHWQAVIEGEDGLQVFSARTPADLPAPRPADAPFPR